MAAHPAFAVLALAGAGGAYETVQEAIDEGARAILGVLLVQVEQRLRGVAG